MVDRGIGRQCRPWDMLDVDCDEILLAEQRRLEQLVSLASDLQKDDFAKQLQLAATSSLSSLAPAPRNKRWRRRRETRRGPLLPAITGSAIGAVTR